MAEPNGVEVPQGVRDQAALNEAKVAGTVTPEHPTAPAIKAEGGVIRRAITMVQRALGGR